MSPLTLDKIHWIAIWRTDVAQYHSAFEPLSIFPVDYEEERHLPYAFDAFHLYSSPNFCGYAGEQCGVGMDQETTIFEGDGRLQTLPHPDCNQLMSLEPDLIEEEYCRVLHLWNTFEAEKWRAEKCFLQTSSYEVLQGIFNADLAVRAASAAARYMEDYSQRHHLHINFQTLFFRIYRPPAFDLYLTDDSGDWSAANNNHPQLQAQIQNGYCMPQQLNQPCRIRV